MRFTRMIPICALILSLATVTLAQEDPGWPRKHVQAGGTVISYQPQVDEWKNFKVRQPDRNDEAAQSI